MSGLAGFYLVAVGRMFQQLSSQWQSWSPSLLHSLVYSIKKKKKKVSLNVAIKFSELKSMLSPPRCALALGVVAFGALGRNLLDEHCFVLRYCLNSQGNQGRRGGLKAEMNVRLAGPGVVYHQPVITV